MRWIIRPLKIGFLDKAWNRFSERRRVVLVVYKDLR